MRFVLLFLFLTFSNLTFCQYSIVGIVRDCKSGAPLPSATLIIDNENTTVLSNEQGEFKYTNIKAGKHVVVCSHVEYKPDSITIYTNTADTTLFICLLPHNDTLSQVTIKAKLPIVSMSTNKIVYNVSNSPIAAGGTAVSALQATPGIRIDPLSGSTLIIGKGTTTIYVNHKKLELSGNQLISFLSTIPSKAIQKIEVIRNPSASYDADAQNGIVNLILKDNTGSGVSGSINGSLQQATYLTKNAGADLNWNLGAFAFSTGLNYINGSVSPVQSIISNGNQSNSLEQNINQRRFSKSVGSRLTVNYKLDQNNTIGAQYIGSFGKPDATQLIENRFLKNGILDSTLINNGRTDAKDDYHTANLYYKRAIDTTGKAFSLDIDYLTNKSIRERNFNTVLSKDGVSTLYPFINTGQGLQNSKVYSGKFDFTLPYKFATLNFGGKASFIKNFNHTQFANILVDEEEANELDNRFRYSENTQALYFSLERELKTINLSGGVRAENTYVNGSIEDSSFQLKQKYTRLFPNLSIEYYQNNNTYGLSYNKSITRPDFLALNPFRWYLNNYNYVTGNPYLSPSYSNYLELSYTYKELFTTKLYYNNIKNGFDQYPDIQTDKNGGINYIQRNFLTTNSVGVNQMYIYVTRSQRFYAITQIDGYYRRVKVNLLNIEKNSNSDIYSLLFYNQNNLQLNKSGTLKGQTIFWYQFPTISSVYRIKHVYSLDIGVSLMLLKKSLQVSANATDILKSYKAIGYSTLTNMSIYNYMDNRKFSISAIYNFGNRKIKSIKREGSNQDEMKRTEILKAK